MYMHIFFIYIHIVNDTIILLPPQKLGLLADNTMGSSCGISWKLRNRETETGETDAAPDVT